MVKRGLKITICVGVVVCGILCYQIGFQYGSHFWDGFYEQQMEEK